MIRYRSFEAEIANTVSADDKKIVFTVKKRTAVCDRSGSSERLIFGHIEDIHIADRRKFFPDLFSEVHERDADISYPVGFQKIEDIKYTAFADKLNERFRLIVGQRTETCAHSARHNNGFQWKISPNINILTYYFRCFTIYSG